MTFPRRKLLKEQFVVANGHGERQKLLQRLRCGAKANTDMARRDGDAFREIRELLVHHGGRGGDQNALAAFLIESVQLLSEALAALLLVMCIFAGGQTVEVVDNAFPVRDSVRANLADDARREDLLSASSADPQEFLEARPVNPRVRAFAQFAGDLLQAAAPRWFIRHVRRK